MSKEFCWAITCGLKFFCLYLRLKMFISMSVEHNIKWRADESWRGLRQRAARNCAWSKARSLPSSYDEAVQGSLRPPQHAQARSVGHETGRAKDTGSPFRLAD